MKVIFCVQLNKRQALKSYRVSWYCCPNILIELIEKHKKRWNANLPYNGYKYLRLKLQLILQGMPLTSLIKWNDLPLHLNTGTAIRRKSLLLQWISMAEKKSHFYLCSGSCMKKKEMMLRTSVDNAYSERLSSFPCFPSLLLLPLKLEVKWNVIISFGCWLGVFWASQYLISFFLFESRRWDSLQDLSYFSYSLYLLVSPCWLFLLYQATVY